MKGVKNGVEHSDRRTGIKGSGRSNPGAWAEHSRYVAEACKNIASHCKDLSSEQAYIFGLLHDIGRYAGVSSERHLIDGYRYCMERGWGKAAQICISHAFMIQDIATSIGEFDVSDEDYLFMKEFVANAVYDDYDRLVQLCDALAMLRVLSFGKEICRRDNAIRRSPSDNRQMEKDFRD